MQVGGAAVRAHFRPGFGRGALDIFPKRARGGMAA